MPRIALMQKTLDLQQIEGKYSAFTKCAYALPVRLSHRIAEDGYGTVTVDGIEISRGKQFFMDSIVKMNAMLIPVGEVAREYDREYVLEFRGFVAENGKPFRDQAFKFRTLPRKVNDGKHQEHDQIALQSALEGMVLLKNEENVLPLDKDAVLNCFGAAQFTFRNSATGAGLINPRWQADFHESVKEHSSFSVNEEISDCYRLLKEAVLKDELLFRAKEKSEVALIFISRTSGEFLDNKPIKGGYYLTDEETETVKAVSKYFDKTVAIINTGYPIDMKWVDEYDIKGVIYTGFAGMFAGYALMELLDGRVRPSGKLSDSWALDYYDYPSSANFMNYKEGDAVPGEKTHGVRLYYEEDIYVGYRYFDTFGKKVKYCFGHGLSYTDFSIAADRCTVSDDKVSLAVTVKNIGKTPGKQTVQLYIRLPEGKTEKADKVLADFSKTELLSPGEKAELELSADFMRFASYDEKKKEYVLEKGRYELLTGDSLENVIGSGSFEIKEDLVLKKVRPLAVPMEEFHKMNRKEPYVYNDSMVVDLKERIKIPPVRKRYVPEPLQDIANNKITFQQLRENEGLLDAFISQLNDRELCSLSVSTGADWYMPWGKGTAGGTPSFRKYGLPSIRVSDGNTGLNIVKPNVGFPSSCTIAATFNKKLAEEVGRAIGEESKENHVAVNLGPGMNIHRNILCGRHPEYFSEDPVLAGVMAGYHAKGLEKTGVSATYKHLFCNNSETSRKGSHSIVSEQALREIYFRVFITAMSIQMPGCLMTSYNALNGIYPAESAEILQNLLREEWGYTGLIMTDWCSYDTIDPVEMIKAGTNWLTEGGSKYIHILQKALKEGNLSRDILRDNARYVLSLVLKYERG